jgi:site-specific recombinase XerC
MFTKLRDLLRPKVAVAPAEPERQRKPKRDISQEDWLKAEEASALLAAAQDDPRLYAIVAVFLGCGLRCNELRMLDLADYEPASRDRGATIHIRYAKNSKQRTVPVPDMTVAALEYWLDYRAQAKGVEARCVALFRGRQGRFANRTLRELVKLTGIKAGLGDRVHPHMCRHTYASHLCIQGVPIEVVRVLMGHTSISTTQIYLAIPDASRFDAVGKLNFTSAA